MKHKNSTTKTVDLLTEQVHYWKDEYAKRYGQVLDLRSEVNQLKQFRSLDRLTWFTLGLALALLANFVALVVM